MCLEHVRFQNAAKFEEDGRDNTPCNGCPAISIVQFQFSLTNTRSRRGESGDEDPGKIHFIVPKFWEKNRMRSETQPYCNTVEKGCFLLRMRFFPQNFGTIKRILPGSSSPSYREDPGTEVGFWEEKTSCVVQSANCLYIYIYIYIYIYRNILWYFVEDISFTSSFFIHL